MPEFLNVDVVIGYLSLHPSPKHPVPVSFLVSLWRYELVATSLKIAIFVSFSVAWRRRRAGLLHKRNHHTHRQSDATKVDREETELEDHNHYDPDETF